MERMMKAPVKIRIKEQRGIDYEKKSHFQYYVLCYYSIIDPDHCILHRKHGEKRKQQ